MRRRDVLGTLATGLLAAPAVLAPRSALALEPVDVEMVLAVDVSRSVDAGELEAQMRGYASAFRDPRLGEAIAQGPVGCIACTLFTWSDWNVQEDLVPWTRIDGTAGAEAFARAIDAAPRRGWLYTSISGAIDHAARRFGQGYEGARRVVDISGDGVNNSGRPLAQVRQDALDRGIVLNGLAVLDRSPPSALNLGQPPLDDYYRDEVIGGPGSFLMVADGFGSFEQAVRRKIVREIAAAPPPGPLMERARA